jgi:hypothetical protein
MEMLEINSDAKRGKSTMETFTKGLIMNPLS